MAPSAPAPAAPRIPGAFRIPLLRPPPHQIRAIVFP